MKRFLDCLQQLLARVRRPRPALSAGEEMHRGSLVGFVVCVVCAFALGGHPGPVVVAAVLGAGFGALTGLLLWVGSDRFKEQPVLPPRPSRWRTEHDGAPEGLPRYVSGCRRPLRSRRSRQR